MIKGHGGNIYELADTLRCRPDEIIDMSSNLNPLGPPYGLVDYLKESINDISRLPEVDAAGITAIVAERYELPEPCVLAGNGTTEFIYAIPRALETRRALIVGPTYSDYQDACAMNGINYSTFITEEKDGFFPDVDKLKMAIQGVDTVFLCNPNNPTGVMIPDEILIDICRSATETYFIIDESYLPFTTDSYMNSAARFKLPNVIILNSMSKVFRIPGIRVGFLIAPLSVIYRFYSYMLPWSVNALAQAAVTYLMKNGSQTDRFLENTRRYVNNERNLFISQCEEMPDIKLFPSSGYFVLAKLESDMTSADLCKRLAIEKILIRDCSNFEGLSDQYVRFSLKHHATNMLLADKLSAILSDPDAQILHPGWL